MYRNQYPDAPNLFSGLRRPYRPPIGDVLRRSWPTCAIGVVLVVVAAIVLMTNEGRAVSTAKALEEGLRDVLVPETTSVVFDKNNGKLVLVSGELRIDDRLVDDTYGISIQAVKLKKLVQMYQWFETADVVRQNGEGDDHEGHTETTYSYKRDWFDKRIDSEAFINPMGHHNPEAWPHNASLQVNQRVRIGGFLLGKELKKMFDGFVPFTSDHRPSNPQIKMHVGLYYHAVNVWDPDVGDVRVQFFYAGRDGDKVTVVGRQAGREIRPYHTESGSQKLLFLYPGIKSVNDVFYNEHAQNRIQTLGLRMVGWFAAFLGLSCLAAILDVLVDEFPYVRGILVLGVTSLPFSLSVSVTLLSIGLGWVIYRPVFGVSLLAASLAPIGFAAFKIHRRKAEQDRHRL